MGATARLCQEKSVTAAAPYQPVQPKGLVGLYLLELTLSAF